MILFKKQFWLLNIIIATLSSLYIIKDEQKEAVPAPTFISLNYTEEEIAQIEAIDPELLLTIEQNEIPSDFMMEIIPSTNFVPERLLAYYHSYTTTDSITASLNAINFPTWLTMSKDNLSAIGTDNLILINPRYGVGNEASFDLVKVSKVSYIKRNHELMLINPAALTAYQSLYQVAKKAGIELVLYSVYRSYEKQTQLWHNNPDPLYLAVPGYSEHHSGLALDIGTYRHNLDQSFANTAAYQFLEEYAYEYGFILRYPQNKSDITGYAYEPWHWRYVGTQIATLMHANDWTLEEYYYQNVELDIEAPDLTAAWIVK